MPKPTLEIDELLQQAYRYAFSLAHDRDLAEELLQDACVAVSRRAGPWRIEYVIRVIRNRYIDLCRRNGTVRFRAADHLDRRPAASASCDGVGPELESALASLRAEERELLYLAAVDGYSARQIARMTGRPRGTVLSAICRAKRKLRERLARQRSIS